ncbi:2-amino-4-hydroxy-6-hydroxymethyldihydropteridine diphosphokinase [Fulvivirga sp. M361]|uniref:2-amino-4-hydroxy-6- hydroxymethyldihydropteridine diphosphokinase n=1 Tax=Fulvivirga sp. M361 TaxID=2594266 RepID=UPI00117ABDE5|nr:2-amino-4-hydroxy-6-hydroxymethyldihydropteridine diphosphokinase [Fulvivirga sp. M361]TRX49212.1 2-amino-4-hydroxy-6-hydroxymethyldihydropteridine diphosphokinase [Fulvivirga sp. M361]
MTEGIYLLLGSNLADKKANLTSARKEIDLRLMKESPTSVLRQSTIYETAAWGKTDQPSFYNQVIEVRTNLSPELLLHELLTIEERIGRVRKEKWGARIIDIDILYYHQTILSSVTLQLPHPGIPERRFTLVPLVELAPRFIHPVLNKTQLTLLDECNDPLDVTEAEVKI